ncbi:hypothetical protein E4U42_003555 [Claviceps africana]|uniref:Uncharacterized protein n=1 Tax=Claviceps africana TaxID=83212 RepID=A0A8K0J6I1_9HYPO|nr:hypothetical protein E4U42_003555 [Claviceps africana]
MAQNHRGNAASLARCGGAGHQGDGIPPSTLAAQLVENISTSARSSRSDENNELKGLFALIQRVKDHPDVLVSQADRVEHNHMLIYVYCRVALDGIRLDDPFVNRAHVHAELIKAINFLRFTIKETPSVLMYKSDTRALVYRAALDEMQNPALNPADSKSFRSMYLPSRFALGQILGEHVGSAAGLLYEISSSSQAIRQISSLAKVITYPTVCQGSTFCSMAVFPQTMTWLLDAWLDLRNVQNRWHVIDPNSPIDVIETVLEVSRAMEQDKDIASKFRNKSHALLTLLCTEMVSFPEELVQNSDENEKARRVYCQALVEIARAALGSYSIGRMAASKLLQEISLLSSQHTTIGNGTDVWASKIREGLN